MATTKSRPTPPIWSQENPITIYAPGTTQNVDLVKQRMCREYMLRLFGGLVCAEANNVPSKIGRGDGGACVSNVTLQQGGSNNIWSLSWDQLRWMNYFLYRQFPTISPALTNTGANNPAFNEFLRLPSWQVPFFSFRAYDTVLNTAAFSQLKLFTTWAGTPGNAASGYQSVNSSATAWSVTPTIEVSSSQSDPTPNAAPAAIRRVVPIQQVIGAATNAYRILLDKGPVFRGFYLNYQVAGVDTGGCFTNFQIVQGTKVIANVSEPWLNANSYQRPGMQAPWGVTSAGVGFPITPALSSASSTAGNYYFDMVEDGYLSEALPTVSPSGPLPDTYLQFNVATAGTLTVVQDQILPLR